jgi:putative ubiquitin-RnfH superfamily antitoxin RatB of RatAB toxin-antitoxin module
VSRPLRITVAWADRGSTVVASVALPAGSTVADAVRAVGGVATAGFAGIGYAIHGQSADAHTPLDQGDRVEITRPLRVDAKSARRQRALDRPVAGSLAKGKPRSAG